MSHIFAKDELGEGYWAHLARPEHVVEVLQERFLDDLAVAEQEHGGHVLRPGGHQHRLQVVVELRAPVAPGDLDADALVPGDEGREPGEGLPARPADPDQEGVPPGLPQDAADAAAAEANKRRTRAEERYTKGEFGVSTALPFAVLP